MIGSGDVIGVAPAPEYTFRILVTPVGPYFKGGLKPVKLRVSEYDRAAPHGTGNIKAGLNYAMSLKPTMEAHREGYAENLYLDSESRTYVEETGGANVLFVKEDGTLVVPQSHTDSILPSITRRSLVQVAQDLGMTVDQRPVEWAEVKAGTFCGVRPVRHRCRHLSGWRNRQQGLRRRRDRDLPGWIHRDRPCDEEASRDPDWYPVWCCRGQAQLGLHRRVICLTYPGRDKFLPARLGHARSPRCALRAAEGFLRPAECAGRELVLALRVRRCHNGQ